MYLCVIIGAILVIAAAIRFWPRKKSKAIDPDQRLLSFIQYGRRIYHLNQPLVCNIGLESGGFYVEYQPLGLFAWAVTQNEAFALFCWYFNTLFITVALENDDLLLARDRVIKKRFWQMVDNVGQEDVCISDELRT